MNSLRMCVACREMKEKEQLFRVVRKDGNFFVDHTFKSNGRGAYVCREASCVTKAAKIKAFERSFSGRINADIYGELEELVKNA